MAVTLVSGRKVVASAGTAERLSSSDIPITRIDIVAETDNTGIIVIGGSGVIASQATRTGAPLSASGSYTLEARGGESLSLKNIWIDAATSGDGVTFNYQTESFPNLAI